MKDTQNFIKKCRLHFTAEISRKEIFMLELKGITKDYPAGSGTVHALKGIDLRFRSSEFVSILGPSGCGKTTMLNIIGGLDGYTSGDLIINGTSTKQYKDRDWDSYRNHSIGFVFQSYNLIPHQTVLSNVELALTLSGVSKSERRKRAREALEQVGLGDQLNKRPAEMSGGQMQRVAIARALVNNPDIILADEPTGALDTETSVSVMEILKQVSTERLVIMVTHNPELAEKYSTRIIRMLDGIITDDSNPLSDNANEKKQQSIEKAEKAKEKKPSMSFATSFMLSLRNLFTKKGRTMLTSFAGSIGIIGIALILAISQGMTTYINTVQEETLSAYPITLEAQTVELSSLIEAFMNVSNDGGNHELDAIYKKTALTNMLNAMNSIETSENDLYSFNKDFVAKVNDPENPLHDAVNGIQYSYPLTLNVYTESVVKEGENETVILESNLEKVLTDLLMEYTDIDMSSMMSQMQSMSSLSGMSMTSMTPSLWQELLPGKNGETVNRLITDQYEIVVGEWPEAMEDIVLVVDKNNELDDVTLYALGLLDHEHMTTLSKASLKGETIENSVRSWSFEEILNKEYRVILNSDCYSYDPATNTWIDLRANEATLEMLYNDALVLKVAGIIRPKEDATAKMLTGSIGYTKALTEYVISESNESDVVKAQRESQNKDILTGLPFSPEETSISDPEKASAFVNHINTLSDDEKAKLFIAISSIPSEEYMAAAISEAMMQDRATVEATLVSLGTSMGMMSEDEIRGYVSSMDDEALYKYYQSVLPDIITSQYAQETAKALMQTPADQLVSTLSFMIDGAAENGEYTDEQLAVYYNKLMQFSDSTYEANLNAMGAIDIDHPSAINIYASSFENKDVITDAIAEYNSDKDELQQIKYTDYIGIMMSSITTIINAITYVLIAFVAISLIVSSIMIGVITLISVQERTKEIGILRAIGASKRDVASMFNAETVIIGFSSGLLGVLVTYLLCIPINIILHKITGIGNLNALLPVTAAVILVIISVLLTLISGIIPSRSASKKDPVVALRTE